MTRARRTAAGIAVSALAASTLLVALGPAQAVAAPADLGLVLTPLPPKQVEVAWDASGLGAGVDWVKVQASPGSYTEIVGVPNDAVEDGLPSSATISDLNVATKYTVTVTVTLVGGGEAVDTIVAQGFKLTALTSRRTVLLGDPVRITGVLSKPGVGTPVAGATVELETNSAPVGDDVWRSVKAATTTDSGAYAFRATPRSNTSYRVIYRESGVGSWITTPMVGVRVRVDLSVRPNPVRFGRAAEFRGALRAAARKVSGAPVLLQRRVAGSWLTVAQSTVAADGTYAIRFTSTNRTDSSYRVRTNAGPFYADSTSRRVTLVVR